MSVYGSQLRKKDAVMWLEPTKKVNRNGQIRTTRVQTFLIHICKHICRMDIQKVMWKR